MFNYQFQTEGITEIVQYQDFYVANGSTAMRQEVLQHSGEYGNLVLVKVRGSKIDIWFRELEITKGTDICISYEHSCLSLLVNISNIITYTCSEDIQLTLQPDRYNFIYGKKKLITSLKKGNYRMMEIHFHKDYLNRYVPHIPSLKKYHHRFNGNVVGAMFTSNIDVNEKMMKMIKYFVFGNVKGCVSLLYLDQTILQLLIECLQAGIKTNIKSVLWQSNDKKSLLSIKSYLIENIDKKSLVEDLVRITGISSRKFKKGFRQLYGVTIHEFLLIKRMEKAKELLLHSDNHVKDIAILTGYSNKSNFSNAFKKRFGCTPVCYKRNS